VTSSDDAIFTANMDRVITSWNTAAARLYGFTDEEAIGRSILLIVPEQGSAETNANFARVARGDTVETYDAIHHHRDGMRIDVSVSVSPIRNARGDVIGAASIVRDITRQRRTEEALRASGENNRRLVELCRRGSSYGKTESSSMPTRLRSRSLER